MKIDTNNSRALGVGEQIVAGDYVRPGGTEDEFMLVNEWDGCCGELVTEDDLLEFRRLIDGETFATGARRDTQEGKGRFDLIPYEAMLSLARRLEVGAAHYGPKNWEMGMPLSRYLSSLRRHSMQVGYDFSEDHAGAVLFNAAAFVATAARINAGILPKELDDICYNEKNQDVKN